MNTYEISEEQSHTFRTELPNIIDDLNLSPNTFRVYFKLKRIAGDNGKCFKTMDNLAAECRMCKRTVQYSLKELQQPFKELNNKPLIKVFKKMNDHGGSAPNEIKIVNVWPENMVEYARKYGNKKVDEPDSGGGAPDAQGGVQEMHGGGASHAPKEEHSKKNTCKEGQCQDNALFHKSEKNEARKSKATKSDPIKFVNALDEEQRKLHDELVAYTPKWGKPLKSEDVCAWFLAKKWSVEQVRIGFAIYKQDASKAANKGRSVDNMGGAMVRAIKTERRLDSEDMELNRDHAKIMSRKYKWMTVLEKYVKIRAGNLREEIELNLPKMAFINIMDEIIRKAKTYA